jgi:hypothetical protein
VQHVHGRLKDGASPVPVEARAVCHGSAPAREPIPPRSDACRRWQRASEAPPSLHRRAASTQDAVMPIAWCLSDTAAMDAGTLVAARHARARHRERQRAQTAVAARHECARAGRTERGAPAIMRAVDGLDWGHSHPLMLRVGAHRRDTTARGVSKFETGVRVRIAGRRHPRVSNFETLRHQTLTGESRFRTIGTPHLLPLLA